MYTVISKDGSKINKVRAWTGLTDDTDRVLFSLALKIVVMLFIVVATIVAFVGGVLQIFNISTFLNDLLPKFGVTHYFGVWLSYGSDIHEHRRFW